MKSNSLTKKAKELLLQKIQPTIGPKSLEEVVSTVLDKSGSRRQLGGKRSGVIVDDNNIPRTMTEFQGITLDCGHVVNGYTDGLQACDFGHIICSRHPLYRCSKCKKLICDIEVKWENDKPVCPDHEFPMIPVVIVSLIILIIIRACVLR